MTDALTHACGELASALEAAQPLIAEPDTDGTSTHGKPGSKPPWNQAAANATLDAHQGIRDLENLLRYLNTGRTISRGGSDANTIAALEAIQRLAPVQTAETCAMAARTLGRFVLAIERLAAIDQAEEATSVEARCPYCDGTMLRVYRRSGRITCLRFGYCRDQDGNHPIGHVTTNQLDGTPCVAWNDGLVT